MNSRTKGHAFERAVSKKLRAIWPECYTCRDRGNPYLDSLGIDLVGTPGYNIQLKAVEKLSPGYHELLRDMPQDGNTNVIIHKKNNLGIVAVISLESFINLINKQ